MPFTKKRESIEIPWASRYVAEHYPDALVKLRCPLGPAPAWMVEQYGEEEALARFRPSRPEVDAVVITPSKLILIEAKVFHWRTGARQLQDYAMEVPHTPELRDFLDRPLEKHLVVVKIFPEVKAYCERRGIKLVEWSTPKAKAKFESQDTYWTREAVEERQKRKKQLEKLGYL